MKKLIITIIITLILITYSCNKKAEQKELFKDIRYKINTMIYQKDYENSIKYIDSVFFNKKASLKKEELSFLIFKEAEIKYLYLNNYIDAYKEMKKIFKNNNLNNKNKIKLLKYLVELSETLDYQNFGIFLEKLNKSIKDKEILYRFINYLKKENKIKKLEEIVQKNELLSNDELQLLKLEILIIKKQDKNIVLKFIDNYIKISKNQKIIDDFKVKKIFYLEQSEKVDYKELLNILTSIKSQKYNNLIKNKKIFYNKKISLYNKK